MTKTNRPKKTKSGNVSHGTARIHHKKKNVPSSPQKKAHSRSSQPIEGRLLVTGSGIGFLSTPDSKQDIRIENEHLNTGLHGDNVRVTLNTSTRGTQRTARVTDILKRKKTDFVGILEKNEH